MVVEAHDSKGVHMNSTSTTAPAAPAPSQQRGFGRLIQIDMSEASDMTKIIDLLEIDGRLVLVDESNFEGTIESEYMRAPVVHLKMIAGPGFAHKDFLRWFSENDYARLKFKIGMAPLPPSG